MLTQLFKSIESQTYKNYEVVISDHCVDGSIKKVCDEWKELINIKYYPFNEKYGSCEANLNNAIIKANGEFIKPMLQDDYFNSNEALSIMVDHLSKSDKKWISVGCVHINENNINNIIRPHVPSLPNPTNLLNGVNTIGSPVVIMFKKDVDILFDENLIWLMDVEFYYRLYSKYGDPILIKDMLITVRLRKDGITNTMITPKIISEEIKYCNKKVTSTVNLLDYPNMSNRVTEFMKKK
jgi:glycosyltransferase involved in cell wall biosynthesis